MSHVCYENEIALVSVGRTRRSRGITKIELPFRRGEKAGARALIRILKMCGYGKSIVSPLLIVIAAGGGKFLKIWYVCAAGVKDSPTISSFLRHSFAIRSGLAKKVGRLFFLRGQQFSAEPPPHPPPRYPGPLRSRPERDKSWRYPMGKNENFAALRAATSKEEEEKQEEKFFDFRIVGPKAAEGCFSLHLATYQGAERA